MNNGLDVTWVILHTLIFWAIIIFIIELRILKRIVCCGCGKVRMKTVNNIDNLKFQEQQKALNSDPDELSEDDDSEVGQIVEGVGEDGEENLEVRFAFR